MDAVVEHNVFLSDLTSNTGTKRQCDIIIRTGNHPRQTITLVEVQARNRNVDLNIFQGWTQKMKDIGAQHLICVSTSGFPDSIKEKAKQSGNTIKLITLKKHGIDRLPIRIFDFKLTSNFGKFHFITPPKLELIKTKGFYVKGFGYSTNEKIFFNSAVEELQSIEDIVRWYLQLTKQTESERPIKISLPLKKHKLFVIQEQRKLKCKLNFLVQVKPNVKEEKVVLYSYEQEEAGALAWAFEGEVVMGDKKIVVKVPAIQNEDGSFRIYPSNIGWSLEPVSTAQIK